MKNSTIHIKAIVLLFALLCLTACSEDMEPTSPVSTRTSESLSPDRFDIDDTDTDGDTEGDNGHEMTFSASEWVEEESNIDI